MLVYDLIRVVTAILDRVEAKVGVARIGNDDSTTPVDAMPTMINESIPCAESRTCKSVPKNTLARCAVMTGSLACRSSSGESRSSTKSPNCLMPCPFLFKGLTSG
ncbi:hypothetical protein GGD40_005696 [Paraburkholderia bryophila]|uniref:Uncharacterized protein n=1 Tax=Paraburkholderia bryophila TaxID=420952 RepID=A0A7Y9WS09_9BURK|nr:hypothetical protein [Paraburkholderia bryophila]